MRLLGDVRLIIESEKLVLPTVGTSVSEPV